MLSVVARRSSTVVATQCRIGTKRSISDKKIKELIETNRRIKNAVDTAKVAAFAVASGSIFFYIQSDSNDR